MARIVYGVDDLTRSIGIIGHGYVSVSYQPGYPARSMEINGGPGTHTFFEFIGSIFGSGPNVTIDFGPLDEYNEG